MARLVPSHYLIQWLTPEYIFQVNSESDTMNFFHINITDKVVFNPNYVTFLFRNLYVCQPGLTH